MKILFLLTQDLQSPSGLGRYYPLAQELALLGHSVFVCALHPDYRNIEKKSCSEGNLRIEYVAPMHVQKKGNIKTYYRPLKLLWIVIQSTWALTWAAVKEHPDLIWIGKPHPMNGVAGIIAKSVRRSRLFLDCDDDEAGSGNFQSSWQRSVITWFGRILPWFSDRITTNTFFTLESLVRQGVSREKITYLSNGVDLGRFLTPDKAMEDEIIRTLGLNGKKVITYIGSMSLSNHGIDLLIKAFKMVHHTRPDTCLLLVGGGEDYEILKSLAHDLNLDEAVFSPGRIHPDAIQSYYRVSDIIIDPVYDNPASKGRSPLKMFEAWACGVSFLTSAVGDRAYLAGDPPAAFFVEAGNPDDMAKGILALISDDQLRATLSQRGLSRVIDFSWQAIARKAGTTLF